MERELEGWSQFCWKIIFHSLNLRKIFAELVHGDLLYARELWTWKRYWRMTAFPPSWVRVQGLKYCLHTCTSLTHRDSAAVLRSSALGARAQRHLWILSAVAQNLPIGISIRIVLFATGTAPRWQRLHKKSEFSHAKVWHLSRGSWGKN